MAIVFVGGVALVRPHWWPVLCVVGATNGERAKNPGTEPGHTILQGQTRVVIASHHQLKATRGVAG
jgi:hypothetical protein